jgi:ABC-type Fe3+/spermidine/putrescine transport system ATPase subunit
MQSEIKALHTALGLTVIHVTHDQAEALAMSDRIVVMRGGVIEQTGSPGEIYNRPRNAFVADFVGSANLVRGVRRPDLEREGMIALETMSGDIVYGMAHGRGIGPEPTFAIRTGHLRLCEEPPHIAVNVWPVEVKRAVFQGDFTQAHVAWGDQELVVRSGAIDPAMEGQKVYMTVNPTHCVLLEG